LGVGLGREEGSALLVERPPVYLVHPFIHTRSPRSPMNLLNAALPWAVGACVE